MTHHADPRTEPAVIRGIALVFANGRRAAFVLAGLGVLLAATTENLPGVVACAFGIAVLAAGVLIGRRAPAEVTGSRRLGPYTLDEKIGEGGMGVIYRAHHEFLRRPTAVKLLAPERAGEQNLRRFEREVQLTSMLTHPNTISIYDFGRTPEGTFYYAMEYVDGCDLEALVDREGPQPAARVAHLLSQLAGALVEAHGVGLVHRDVKPANVMLCERGGSVDVVKVLDFGLTKEMRAARDVALTDEQRIVGTPLYLSPEAVSAPERVDPRSDLYALGAVGYFLLTGAAPFGGDNVIDVCFQHLHAVPVRPSERLGAEIPRELEALILSCLEKSPERRPASAADVRDALAPLAAEWTKERAEAWQAPRERSAAGERRLAVQATESDVHTLWTACAA
jgi:eukaryotic-like serine/threonine-protein kinase